MTGDRFILDGHRVVRCDDLERWATQFLLHTRDWRVALTGLPNGVTVSTIFLGIDVGGERLPELFETMTFGGGRDEERRRYSCWQDAVEGHELAVKLVKDEAKETTR